MIGKRAGARRGIAGFILLGIGGFGCGSGSDLADPGDTRGPGDTRLGLIVSEPITLASLASGVAASQTDLSLFSADLQVAYVSLAQGTVPRGIAAHITNLGNGFTTDAPVVDGAVDATPVPAAEGDTIQLIARDSSGDQSVHVDYVKRRVPPVVVRSSSGAGKTDTPLLIVVSIYFSEPMAGSSITPATVRLLLDGAPIAGTVSLSPDGLRVEFKPSAPLVPGFTYDLLVTKEVRDLSGDMPQADYQASFTLAPAADTVTFTAVSTGAEHTCAMTDRAAVYCWGANGRGQLGMGDVLNRSVPTRTRVEGDNPFQTIEANGPRSCGLMASGRPRCWGALNEWQWGDFEINAVFNVLALGNARVCGIGASGTVHCLGPYLLADSSLLFVQPGEAHDLSELLQGIRFRQIRLGAHHGCGIDTSGTARCWGPNQQGQLGDGSNRWSVYLEGGSAFFLAPATSGGFRFTELSLGNRHTCGLADGRAYCWGTNLLGQLGTTEFFPESNVPAVVQLEAGVSTIDAGEDHTCAVTSAGEGYCWGANQAGQLGDGTRENRMVPTRVSGGLKWASIAAGGSHSCGRTVEGVVYCWGANHAGQLGNGRQEDESSPVRVLLQR